MPVNDYSDFGDIRDQIVDYLKNNGGAGSQIDASEVGGYSRYDLVEQQRLSSDTAVVKRASQWLPKPEIIYNTAGYIKTVRVNPLEGLNEVLQVDTMEWSITDVNGDEYVYSIPYSDMPMGFYHHRVIETVKVRLVYKNALYTDWSLPLSADIRIEENTTTLTNVLTISNEVGGSRITIDYTLLYGLDYVIQNKQITLVAATDRVVSKVVSETVYIPDTKLKEKEYNVIFSGEIMGLPVYMATTTFKKPHVYEWALSTTTEVSYVGLSAYIDSGYTSGDIGEYLVITGTHIPVRYSMLYEQGPEYPSHQNKTVFVNGVTYNNPDTILNQVVSEGSLLSYDGTNVKVRSMLYNGNSISPSSTTTIPLGINHTTPIRTTSGTYSHVGGMVGVETVPTPNIYNNAGNVLCTMAEPACNVGVVKLPEGGALLIGGENKTSLLATVQLYDMGQVVSLLSVRLPLGLTRVSAVHLGGTEILIAGTATRTVYQHSASTAVLPVAAPSVLLTFNYTTGNYRFVKPPINNMFGIYLLEHAGKVYALGGYDESRAADRAVHEVYL